jgi:hypothetical protein
MITQGIKSNPMSQIISFAKKEFASAILFFVVLVRTHPMLFAKFGPIDDHEIAVWLQNRQEQPFKGLFFNLMNNDELSNWSQTGRYRPFAYFMRILETSIFGDYVWMFYMERFFLLTCSILIIAKATQKLTGLYGGSERAPYIALALALSILPAWQDVILRLGPSEIYLIFGYSLFLHGLSRSPRTSHRYMFIGALIAAGSKENGIFLLLAFSVFAVMRRERNLNKTLKFLSALSIALFISLGPILFRKNLEVVDIYGKKITLETLGQVLVSNSNPVYFYIACLAILVALSYCLMAKKIRRYRIVYLTFISSCFLISEQIFYRVKIGGYSRYSIVSQINLVILLFILFSILASRVWFQSKQKPVFIFSSVLIIWVATLSSVPIVGVSNIRTHAEEMREMTISYQEFLNQILEHRKSSNVLIIASKDGDSEAASGTQDFLRRDNPNLKTQLLVSNGDWIKTDVADTTCVILGDAIGPPIRDLGCNQVLNFNTKYFPSY